MSVRIVRRRGLQVWMPEREDRRPDERLHLWRQVQLLPRLHLQDQLSASIGAAHFDLSPGPGPGPKDVRRSF